jgi:hypothetical protein
MRQIVYSMHFVSQTSRAPDRGEVLRTTGSATSCVLSTVILPSGVQTELKASAGELAFFESEIRVTGPDKFEENGEISFGDDSEHVLRFTTLGEGHLARDLQPGVMAATASWKIEGGEGQFTEARGFIASNFTINNAGERSDFHCGLIFIP